MRVSATNKLYTLLLAVALLFGQVAAGFLHNSHDAHEAVSTVEFDKDATVLLNHGEHCKVCAVDWAHQFVATSFDISIQQLYHFAPSDFQFLSLSDLDLLALADRGPPIHG